MATCEVCEREVPSMETLSVVIAGKLHYACSQDHIAALVEGQKQAPPERPKEAPTPPKPPANRRGRKPGSKNKPKAPAKMPEPEKQEDFVDDDGTHTPISTLPPEADLPFATDEVSEAHAEDVKEET